MKRMMSIAAVALMMAGSTALACDSCGCAPKKPTCGKKAACSKKAEKKCAADCTKACCAEKGKKKCTEGGKKECCKKAA